MNKIFSTIRSLFYLTAADELAIAKKLQTKAVKCATSAVTKSEQMVEYHQQQVTKHQNTHIEASRFVADNNS